MTKIVKINKNSFNVEQLDIAISALKNGQLVAFPTETVYGLGANALDENSVKNIFVAKGRPSDNPLIVHIGEESQLNILTESVPDVAKKLIKKFWPGPLTLIFKKKPVVPYVTTGGLDTVAIRLPNHPIALKLLQLSKIPTAAPSANLSGKPSPTLASHVIEDLNNLVDVIIDGGDVDVGVESTVLDVTTNPPTLLRPGSITLEMLKDCIGEVTFYKKNSDGSKEIAKSPGMKYRHYSPNAEIVLVLSNFQQQVKSIIKNNIDKKIGIISLSNNQMFNGDIEFFSLSSIGDYAKNVFKLFREYDQKGVDLIILEGVKESGLGLALMNRLKKAASKIVE